MLGELSGEDEPDCSLDLPGGHGGLLVVEGETSSLSGHLSFGEEESSEALNMSIETRI